MARRARVTSLLASLLLSACVVETPTILDDGFWACPTPEACGPDQACAEGNVYSTDFCRPACDQDDPETCPDGVCTASGACLEACSIEPDGSPIGCPGEDFTCVRTSAERDVGVCYPVQSCSRSADCPHDGTVPQLCLNEALGLPATTSGMGLRFDNLYCTAAPDEEGRCPTGYLSFRVPDSDSSGASSIVCYPPCAIGDDGPFCPPATTCFRGFGELVGLPDTPPCLPGVWGLPCEDDTHCLIGRCLPVGGGRRACTETCAWAEENAGGCGGLERISEAFGVPTRASCEEVEGAEVCVPRYDLLSLCDEQLECVGSNATCAPVRFDSTMVHVCLRTCAADDDCVRGTGGQPGDYRCIPVASVGICSRTRSLGSRCSDDLDCREGSCCNVDGELSQCLTTCP